MFCQSLRCFQLYQLGVVLAFCLRYSQIGAQLKQLKGHERGVTPHDVAMQHRHHSIEHFTYKAIQMPAMQAPFEPNDGRDICQFCAKSIEGMERLNGFGHECHVVIVIIKAHGVVDMCHLDAILCQRQTPKHVFVTVSNKAIIERNGLHHRFMYQKV